MKKVFAICTVLILSLFAVGCEKTIELTDEENQLIAEYSAELLLKYDKNYKSKYFDNDEFVSPHRRDELATGTDASTEITTELTTEELDTEVTTEVKTTEDTETTERTTESTTESTTAHTTEDTTDTHHIQPDMEDVSSHEIKADYNHNDFDLAKFAGVNNVSIKYQYSRITDTYPAYDSSGMYIGVEAPDGYKLLVLKFRIENLTNDKQDIDLYSKDILYKIILDNKKCAKQLFTILMDDMYTYQGTISESGISDVVLLFQVSNGMADSRKDMKLQVETEDDKAIVQLQ